MNFENCARSAPVLKKYYICLRVEVHKNKYCHCHMEKGDSEERSHQI